MGVLASFGVLDALLGTEREKVFDMLPAVHC